MYIHMSRLVYTFQIVFCYECGHVRNLHDDHGDLFFKFQHVAGTMGIFAIDNEYKNTHLGFEQIYFR